MTILDDEADPKLEGNETFVVFLSSPSGSVLVEPYIATVDIYDHNLDCKYSCYNVSISSIVGHFSEIVLTNHYETSKEQFLDAVDVSMTIHILIMQVVSKTWTSQFGFFWGLFCNGFLFQF